MLNCFFVKVVLIFVGLHMVHILTSGLFMNDDFWSIHGVAGVFFTEKYIYFAIELATSIPNSPPLPT